MNAAKIADAVLQRLPRFMSVRLATGDAKIIRDMVIEEIGKEVVAERIEHGTFRHRI